MSSVRLLYNNPFTGETEKRLYFSKTTCFPNSKNRREKKKIKVSVILKPRASISPSATQPLPPPPLLKIKQYITATFFAAFSQELASQPSPQPRLSWSPCLHTVSQHFSTLLEIPQQSTRPVAGSGLSISARTRKGAGVRGPHLSSRRGFAKTAPRPPSAPLPPSFPHRSPGNVFPAQSAQLMRREIKLHSAMDKER